MLAFAGAALADVTTIDPSSGHTHQGGSVSAAVSLAGTALTCLSATPGHHTIVVWLDPVAACGAGPRVVGMDVTTSQLTPTGDHTITLREVNVFDAVVHRRDWTVTVSAPPTTTTTHVTVPTTSLVGAVTSTTATTPSTTSPPATTTTTRGPTEVGTTTTTGLVDTTTTTTGPAGTTTTTTTQPARGEVGPVSTTTTSGGEVVDSPRTVTDPPSRLEGPSSVTAAGDSQAADATDRTASFFHGPLWGLPPVVADVILSPLLIAELVVAAMLSSGAALLPVAGVGAVAGWVAWRLAAGTDLGSSESDSFLTSPTWPQSPSGVEHQPSHGPPAPEARS